MNLLDIHTHHLPEKPGEAIINSSPDNFSPLPGQYYSIGYHPWYLSPDKKIDWNTFCNLISHPQVLAVGEAGLDKIRGANLNLQQQAFIKQIRLSHEMDKPLIIHAVKSYNEIIELKKTLHPNNPWIIHGFRGKKELAQQLTTHGIHLSFGEKYNEEALQVTPVEMIFIETDESSIPILQLYHKAADLLCLSLEDFKAQIQQNIHTVFFK